MPKILGSFLFVVAASGSSGIRFEDVTAASGIDFVHYNGHTDEKFMVETMGSGGGFFDYDGDGDLDIYLVNGAPVPGSEAAPEPPRNALYRNDGNGGFTDVAEAAGVPGRGYGMGMTAGDVDNDGDLDLYVTNFGPNVFYRNRGDGTFEEETERAGLAASGWSTSASFADYDADGNLDLYVGRYVDFALDNHKFCGNQAKNIKAYCHPDVYDPVPGILFRGLGDGTFVDVTREAGVYVEEEGKNLGVVWGDYDNDSDIDLYVANDSMRSFLFRNEGGGRFTDVTLLAGVGYSIDGKTQAGMGTDMADWDGDGYLDITKTNLDFEYNSMYRGGPAGIFTDEAYETGVAEVSLNYVGFGTFFFDFDNDGLLDVFVANGHIIDNIHLFNSVSTY
ncbi:MAG: FG-GAP repeat domain-containing protein, partial [Vicinamibacteria bacterium]